MGSRDRAFRSRALLLVAALAFGASVACSKSSPASPTPPSTSTLNLTGTWGGSAIDSTGPGVMTWQLTQSGTSVTGSVVIADSLSVTIARGTLSGTLSGSSLQFTVTIPAGGFDGNASCSGSFTGTASATASSLSGSYAGTQSCTGAFSGGAITLSKQ